MPPPEEILLAVRAAAAGDALVSSAPMRRLVEHFVRAGHASPLTWIASRSGNVRCSS
ncbi:MAG: hypothetical protein ACR2MP_31745 [Streptosporangiaceae bacterium]